MIMFKSTATANSNTALVKYWGKANSELKTPLNNNISLTIDSHRTKVTVEFSEDYKEDHATLNGEPVSGKILERTSKHLDYIRKLAGVDLKAKGAAEINFPVGAGLASSASGFAALTVAACTALGMKLDKKELSIISRNGSGSSCRSIYGGYVEWLTGKGDKDSYAVQIADEKYFDIRDISVIVSKKPRKVDTRGGMEIAQKTSVLFDARLKAVKEITLPKIRQAILDKNFSAIGKYAELDSNMLHATAITSMPILLYWQPETLEMMHLVRDWREEGLEVYYTADTGANLHIFCLPKDEKELLKRLKEIPIVQKTTSGKPGEGAKVLKEHLF